MGKTLKNTVFTAFFTDVTNEGFGVCRYTDGRAVFVPQSLPGETAEVRIIKEYKAYLIGRVERLIAASGDRREPDCAVFGRCGGCAYRHVDYKTELAFKAESVKRFFRRNAGIDIEVPLPLHGNPDAYRNKMVLPLVEEDGKTVGGFYARHSHKVVPCTDCRLHSPDFGRIASRLCKTLKGLPVYDEGTGTGLLRHLCLRRTEGGDFCVFVVINGDRLPGEEDIAGALMAEFPEVKSFSVNINKARTNAVTGGEWRLIAGEKTLTETLCGKRFLLSPASFFQVNAPMAEVLYNTAASLADIKEGDTVFDLYCGVGSAGLCICPDGALLCGVEIVPQAVENARANARENGRSDMDTRFICGDAAEGFKLCRDAFGKSADVVIVDPPRAGLDESLVSQIAAESPRCVVYISCNPATLARDAARFAALGYAVSRIVPVDMFPRTAHVECVCLLTNEKAK